RIAPPGLFPLLAGGHGGDQRGDAAHGDAAVLLLRLLRVHLEVALAVALGDQVLRRQAEHVGQRGRDRLGAAIRQRQIGEVGADRVGVALDQEGLGRVLVEQAADRLGQRLQPRDRVLGNRRRAEIEGDGVEVDAAHAVAHAGRIAHLVDRVEPAHRLDRRLVEELVIGALVVGAAGVEDVFLGRDAEPERRQVEAGIAPAAPFLAVGPVAGIDEDMLAPVRHDARTAHDVAVAVADRHHLHAVGAHHGLAGAAARQLLIVDVAGVVLEAAAVVALDHGVAAELDDQPVADLAQHVGAFTPLAPFLPALDAAAFLTPQRLHLDRSLQLLGLGVGRRRRAGRLLGLRLSRLALGRGVFRFLGAVEDRRVAAGAGGIVVARPGIVAWATAVVVIRPRRGGVGRPFAGRRRGLVLIRRPLAIAIAVATVAARLGLRVIIGGRPRTVARRALAGRRRSLVLSGRSVAVATIAARLGLALIGRRCGALLV